MKIGSYIKFLFITETVVHATLRTVDKVDGIKKRGVVNIKNVVKIYNVMLYQAHAPIKGYKAKAALGGFIVNIQCKLSKTLGNGSSDKGLYLSYGCFSAIGTQSYFFHINPLKKTTTIVSSIIPRKAFLLIKKE